MSEPPTLSIAIPTFNRSSFLAELLDSIVAQNQDDIEVIVSDDASTDNTYSIVKSYSNALPNLGYIFHPINIGIDKNFLAVVAHATKDFVWIVGDDDRLEPGSLDETLSVLRQWPDIAGLTLGVIDYDNSMKKPIGVRSMPPTARIPDATSVFTNFPELLGLVSSLVVNRKMWQIVCDEEPVINFANYYIQVFILGRMLQRFGGWAVLNFPCIGYRSDNDQFLSRFGWLNRLRIDIIAYEQISDALFKGELRVQNAMRRKIFSVHVLSRLRNAKIAGGRTPGVMRAIALLFRYYRGLPEFWHSALPTLIAPAALVRVTRKFYRKYSPTSGAARANTLRR